MSHASHRRIQIPKPPTDLPESVGRWVSDLERVLALYFTSREVDENAHVHGQRYFIATRPDASERNDGDIIFVKDEIAGQQFQGSDGTTWRYLG